MIDRLLAGAFNARLGRRYRTLMVGGAGEPLYLPARGSAPALLRYCENYPRSVLHELAHWCLAGHQRRALVDFGYWYQPPPRSATQQLAFYRAELRPQALECLFCRVCAIDFEVSTDQVGIASEEFSADVAALADQFARQGLRGRAREVADLMAGACATVVRASDARA